MAFVKALLRCIRNKNTNQTSKTEVNSIIVNHPPSIFPEELKAAEQHFYKKRSQEVIQYLPKKKYEKLATQSNDGLLMYTGCILPGNDVSIVGNFTDTMRDLSMITFCVPMLERHSPLAYSIALDVHWNHPTVKHSGIETTLR